MIPYWLLFLLAAWRASIYLRPVPISTAHLDDGWRAMFVVLVLMIGLRHEVGGDWFNYLDHLIEARYQSLSEALLDGDDLAYSLLNWLAGQMDWGVYFVNLVCAALFAWGLVVFCRAQPLPWLALVVAVPYLITVVAMGYTRQATAIGLAMLGLAALADRKILRYAVFMILAALFHKSAVILIPLAVLAGARNRLWSVFWLGLVALLFYDLLLQESVERLRVNYLEAEYESSGAAIRVAMNAVPAVLFLWFRKHFDMPQPERVFWTWMSLGAIGFIALLMLSSSSTAVDRVALYWIPLQLYVLSRLPGALERNGGSKELGVVAVVGYSATVLFVWLVFSVHSYLWLPYQFYPWVWLWE